MALWGEKMYYTGQFCVIHAGHTGLFTDYEEKMA